MTHAIGWVGLWLFAGGLVAVCVVASFATLGLRRALFMWLTSVVATALILALARMASA